MQICPFFCPTLLILLVAPAITPFIANVVVSVVVKACNKKTKTLRVNHVLRAWVPADAEPDCTSQTPPLGPDGPMMLLKSPRSILYSSSLLCVFVCLSSTEMHHRVRTTSAFLFMRPQSGKRDLSYEQGCTQTDRQTNRRISNYCRLVRAFTIIVAWRKTEFILWGCDILFPLSSLSSWFCLSCCSWLDRRTCRGFSLAVALC